MTGKQTECVWRKREAPATNVANSKKWSDAKGRNILVSENIFCLFLIFPVDKTMTIGKTEAGKAFLALRICQTEKDMGINQKAKFHVGARVNVCIL